MEDRRQAQSIVFIISGHSGVLVNACGNIDRFPAIVANSSAQLKFYEYTYVDVAIWLAELLVHYQPLECTVAVIAYEMATVSHFPGSLEEHLDTNGYLIKFLKRLKEVH